MDNKVLVNEEALITLSARTELQMYMIEVLASFFIYHNVGQGHQEQLLKDMDTAMSKFTVPHASTERDAIFNSDVAVLIQGEGQKMIQRLRDRLEGRAPP